MKKIFWVVVLLYTFIVMMLCFFPADAEAHCKNGHKGVILSQSKDAKK